MLTQVKLGQLQQELQEQKHEPIVSLSEAFTVPAGMCSIVKKYSYAVLEVITTLDYIITARKVYIFT